MLARYAKELNVDIAPLLVAEVCFVNIASSLTPFGNPQNLLLWEESGISARQFVLGTWQLLLLSGALTVAALYFFRRGERGTREVSAPIGTPSPLLYLVAVGAIIFSMDALGASTSLALGVAFLLGFGFTFRCLRQFVKEFDYRSLLLLCLLIGFIAVAELFLTPEPTPCVVPAASGSQPCSAIFVGLTSNVISNVPATQLLLGTVGVSSHVAPKIAVEAGLAGNITPVGSFANILALVMVHRTGLSVKKAILLQFVVRFVLLLASFPLSNGP